VLSIIRLEYRIRNTTQVSILNANPQPDTADVTHQSTFPFVSLTQSPRAAVIVGCFNQTKFVEAAIRVVAAAFSNLKIALPMRPPARNECRST
jgi:hypothetical protein